MVIESRNRRIDHGHCTGTQGWRRHSLPGKGCVSQRRASVAAVSGKIPLSVHLHLIALLHHTGRPPTHANANGKRYRMVDPARR